MTASVEERPVQEAEAQTGHGLPDREPKAESATKTKRTVKVDEYASFDDLLSKPARERDVTINAGERKLKLHLRAIGGTEYDQLVANCPPSPEERDRGLIFDQDKFAPRLIAAVVTRPRMDLDQANRLYRDPNWSGGESGGLYRACVEICQVGLDVPFNGSG